MAELSSMSTGYQSVTPSQDSNIDSGVAALELINEDDLENDTSDDSFSDQDLLKLGSQDPEEPEGFLKAKNASDAYFLAHGKSNPTSNNLLSARSNWKLPLTVSNYLESFGPQPLQSAEANWKQWTAELIEGYSLLFYGIGSKRATLNEFVKQQLVECLGWEGLVINGFQTGADLSNMLGELEEIALSSGIEGEQENKTQVKKKVNSLEHMESRARRLCTLFDGTNSNLPRCVVMIHNLDGNGFRSPRIQTILSLLAAQPFIHLIASIDHIYAPILLPSHIASARPYVKDSSNLLKTFPSNYNFLYHHLPTQTPYTLESLLSGTVSTLLPANIFPPTMVGTQNLKSDIAQNGATTVKATLHVLSSLTQRGKLLFKILAENQILKYQSLSINEIKKVEEKLNFSLEDNNNKRIAPKISISSNKLFDLARSEFVASVQSQMEALLVEFRDHGIILSGLPPVENGSIDNSNNPNQINFVDDDEDWLWIALSLADLQLVLDKLDDL